MFLFSFDLVAKQDENSISHTAVESLLHKFAVQDFIRLKLLPHFLHKRYCYIVIVIVDTSANHSLKITCY